VFERGFKTWCERYAKEMRTKLGLRPSDRLDPGHQAQEVDVSVDGLMLLTGYDRLQEEEVNWLAGCLLLPRDTLVYIKRRRIELADAAAIFGVSRRMLSYRLAATGVNRQFA